MVCDAPHTHTFLWCLYRLHEMYLFQNPGIFLHGV